MGVFDGTTTKLYLIMCRILVYRKLTYEVGIRYLKIKKLNTQHAWAKIAKLITLINQSLPYNSCNMLDIWVILMRQP